MLEKTNCFLKKKEITIINDDGQDARALRHIHDQLSLILFYFIPSLYVCVIPRQSETKKWTKEILDFRSTCGIQWVHLAISFLLTQFIYLVKNPWFVEWVEIEFLHAWMFWLEWKIKIKNKQTNPGQPFNICSMKLDYIGQF